MGSAIAERNCSSIIALTVKSGEAGERREKGDYNWSVRLQYKIKSIGGELKSYFEVIIDCLNCGVVVMNSVYYEGAMYAKTL